MVLIVSYQQKENLEGKAFFTLTVQGEPEMVVSQKGKPYLTARRASLMTTFDELTCSQMIGKQLQGEIMEVDCEPYEITTEAGEVITKNKRYEYLMEEVSRQAEEAVFEQEAQLDPFAQADS